MLSGVQRLLPLEEMALAVKSEIELQTAIEIRSL
jgi:hypothetical protein